MLKHTYLMVAMLLALPVTLAYGNAPFSETPVSEEELDTMRGGFIVANGLQLDFGVMQNTMINGQLVSSIHYGTTTPTTNLSQSDLNSLLQLSQANLTTLTNAQGLVNIITNTKNNTLIQNIDTLNVNVANLQSFRNQMALTPLLNIAPQFR